MNSIGSNMRLSYILTLLNQFRIPQQNDRLLCSNRYPNQFIPDMQYFQHLNNGINANIYINQNNMLNTANHIPNSINSVQNKPDEPKTNLKTCQVRVFNSYSRSISNSNDDDDSSIPKKEEEEEKPPSLEISEEFQNRALENYESPKSEEEEEEEEDKSVSSLNSDLSDSINTSTHAKKLPASKKIKKENSCGHPEEAHYAKGLCYNCYHKYGRVKKPWKCNHDILYARGLCQQCYVGFYNRKRKRLGFRKKKYNSGLATKKVEMVDSSTQTSFLDIMDMKISNEMIPSNNTKLDINISTMVSKKTECNIESKY